MGPGFSCLTPHLPQRRKAGLSHSRTVASLKALCPGHFGCVPSRLVLEFSSAGLEGTLGTLLSNAVILQMWKLRPQGSHPTMGTKLRTLDSRCISTHPSIHPSTSNMAATPHTWAPLPGCWPTSSPDTLPKTCKNLLDWPLLMWQLHSTLLVPLLITLQPHGLSSFSITDFPA